MDVVQLDDPWCQLVSTTAGERDEEEVVPVIGDKFSIGRKGDLVISNNKHVSACHCILSRNQGSKVTIRDTSTNGILLNGKRLERNVEVELSHDDVISLVHKRDNPSLNVGYRFKSMCESREEEEGTLSYQADNTETLAGEETDTVALTEEVVEEVRTGKKRRLNEEDSEKSAPVMKSSRVEQDPPSSPHTASTRELTSQEQASTVAPSPNTEEASAAKKPSMTKMDSIEATLICEICQEILHDCVSLQPCNHSYCGGCYSEWMAHSNTCPACRNKVERISKNHIVNNLVEAYLRAHPERKRAAEDLKELDDKNKITRDMLYPKKKHRDYDTDDTDDYDDDDDTDSSDTWSGGITLSAPPILGLCPQCPHHHTPSSSSSSFPYPHTCSSSTQHVLCQCCLRPMPNRNDPSIPQRCQLCNAFYCSQYWTCTSTICSGCIAPLKEFNFQATCLNGLLGNAYECNVLKSYLEGKGVAIRDFLQTCCERMQRNEYVCSDSRVTPATLTCRTCALKTLKELAYMYRRDVPAEDLPDEVSRRPDCYWGKECRTQYNKPEHAKKFNHVCEKTRHS